MEKATIDQFKSRAEDGEELVVETEDHFITFGRVEKEHVTPPYIKARIASEKSATPPNEEDSFAKEAREKEEKNRALTREFKKNGRLPEEVLPDCCGDCGQHYKFIFFKDEWKKPEEHVIVDLLKKQKVCNSQDHRGSGLIKIGKSEKIGYLGRRPYNSH